MPNQVYQTLSRKYSHLDAPGDPHASSFSYRWSDPAFSRRHSAQFIGTELEYICQDGNGEVYASRFLSYIDAEVMDKLEFLDPTGVEGSPDTYRKIWFLHHGEAGPYWASWTE